MTAQPSDLFTTLRRLRKELTDCQVRVTEALNTLSALNLPDEAQLHCPDCRIPFRSPFRLAEHRHLSHDGPVPEHWLATERLAGITDGAGHEEAA